MSDPFGFMPEPVRTAAVSIAVRSSMADSVGRLLSALENAGQPIPRNLHAWRAALLSNPRPAPQLWALYHDLAKAALEDQVDQAVTLAAELLGRDASRVEPPGAVLTFSQEALGEDLARSLAVVDHDRTCPLQLRAVDAVELARVRELMPACRALFDAAAPELRDEVDALGHQVLLGVGEGVLFGGAASVFLWGAVVLNPTLVGDRIDLAESLSHETAHALLFGLVLGADLTANDPGERFSSPLRADPRPIEGIMHAVYVLARMIWTLRRLAKSNVLTAAERGRVSLKIARNLALFQDGLRTVDAHARFTPEGQAIFAACRAAMAGVTGETSS